MVLAKHYGQVRGRCFPATQKAVEPKILTADDYVRLSDAQRNAEAIRKRLIAMCDDPMDKRHGTTTGYKYGCRCNRCKSAQSEFAKQRRMEQGAVKICQALTT